jgi:hypothetical protein
MVRDVWAPLNSTNSDGGGQPRRDLVHRKGTIAAILFLEGRICASVSLSKPPSGIQAAANEVPGRPRIDAQHK